MSGDIVERLRLLAATYPLWGEVKTRSNEAADEIERLRAERDVSRLIISDGAWFVHGTNYDDYPLALFGDELSARRWADEQGYGYVVFWPFGKTWSEMRK